MGLQVMKRWTGAAALLAASLAPGRALADPPNHFLDIRVTATDDVIGTFTTQQSGATSTTSGATSSVASVGAEIVHSWEWLPNYGGVTLSVKLGLDALKGDFLGPGETVYSPNLGLGLGYVQPVNRYFQIELVPTLAIGEGYLSYGGSQHSGLSSKYGLRGNFVFTIADVFQVLVTVGYSWYSFSFPDLGATLSAHGACAGGGLGASF